MNDALTKDILLNAKNILSIEDETIAINDLDGYQVTKAELFAFPPHPSPAAPPSPPKGGRLLECKRCLTACKQAVLAHIRDAWYH